MGFLKPWHIIVLLVVILLLFGSNKLPDLARSIGKSLHILKDEAKSLTGDETKDSTGDDSAGPDKPEFDTSTPPEARDK